QQVSAVEANAIRENLSGRALSQFDDGLKANPVPVVSGARGFSERRAEYAKARWVLMAAVGLVILVVCANVSSLMLASIRLETFAQTTRITKPTAAISTHRAFAYSARRSENPRAPDTTGTGFALRPSSNCDSARPERFSRIAFASTALTCWRACSSVAHGLSRPIIMSHDHARSSNLFIPG